MALPNPLTVLLKNQQKLVITDAVSESNEDVLNYDNATYRNILPANYIGRAWGATLLYPFASGNPPEAKDDAMTQTAPHFLQKTRTMMKWLDSGGAVRGKCWADQFVGYGDSATFIS